MTKFQRCSGNLKSSAQVVVLLILLVWWLQFDKFADSPFQLLEFFAGKGRVARLGKRAGYRSAAVDILYGEESAIRAGRRPPMDINSSAGLVLLRLLRKSLWV